MLKKYFLFPFLSGVLLPSSIDLNNVYFVSEYIGPLKYANPDVILNLTANSTSIDYNCHFLLTGYVNNKKVYTVQGESFPLLKKTPYKTTIKIKTYDYLTYDGLEINLKLINESNDTILKSSKLKLLPINSKTYNPIHEEVNKNLNPSRYIFGSILNYSKTESFNFSNCQEYFTKDQYLKLDLSQFSFTYNHIATLKYRDANIIVKDINNCFDYISKDEQGVFYIPIKLIQSNKNITMNYAKTMYVKEKTLQMSFIPREGFVETNNFYFPINKQEEVMGDMFNITLESVGDNESTFSWNCTLKSITNFIGDCDTSEYCIKGGIRE